MALEQETKGLGIGIYSIPSDAELIPQQAAQDSLGWISTDGKIELCRGRLLVGAEETVSGYVQGDGWGYRADGTGIHFRKTDTKIQYYDTTTSLWVDIITGLTDGKEYTFSPYSSQAGTFIYATGYDGIYKIHTASPGSYTSLYDSTINFKGKSIIVTSRMHMWDLENDKTGHYGSYVDSAKYTTVSAEALSDASSGTLAFKAGDAHRTCFGVQLTVTTSGQVFKDDYDGNLTGDAGGTGTINYTTGEYTTDDTGAGTVYYKWENSNDNGVTDFSHSEPRQGGEGFLFRQDEGGGNIETIKVQNGKFYSVKDNGVYELSISTDDLSATNLLFRKNIGIEYWRSAISTGKGTIFMDTSNLDKPQLTILKRNLYGDNLEPYTLAQHFDFSNYYWDMCAMETFGEFVVFSGRSKGSTTNDKLFLYNVRKDTIDILPYAAKTITSNKGLLFIGDTLTYNSYQILSGWDDDNYTISNYWISNDNLYGSEYLKKVKRLKIKGLISRDQKLEVSVSYDNSEFTLVGTILGNGNYVDASSSFTIGANGIGTTPIGGENDFIDGNFYLAELKIPGPKFRKRTIKLEATGIGYVSCNLLDDTNIMRFSQRLPSKYRTKQNTSLDGTQTDQ